MEKKLYRSRDDQMVAGVCAGIAEYLGIDPTIVRVIAVLLALGNGAGILLYIILAVVMPEAPALPGPREYELENDFRRDLDELDMIGRKSETPVSEEPVEKDQ